MKTQDIEARRRQQLSDDRHSMEIQCGWNYKIERMSKLLKECNNLQEKRVNLIENLVTVVESLKGLLSPTFRDN